MNQVGRTGQLEYRVARGFTADLIVRHVLRKIVSMAAGVFFLICAVEMLAILGQLGYFEIEIALLLVSPLYFAALGRLWAAFGVEFGSGGAR